ncbi:hypothetical protein FA95DRAFT_1571127 [Auriscalpium vulgare]|uniref:Uncharacterized protein n=1 Tax=Auriscalpium vulgare TaxID=40419 RepID=A0ACB8RZJ8_9AGAM|nr:hypothetical protein FA95DRAFT_1571127 [Auriscalpium vulgare]
MSPFAVSLPNMPIELLDAVCAHLPNHDLVALARTSSHLHPIAQRRLYRHLDVSAAAHNLDVVVTLARSPAIARHVRTFSVAISAQQPVFRAFYRALADALSAMSELTALGLHVHSGASWVLAAARGARATAYPRLASFTCSFPFDSHVARFLEGASALERLELDTAPTANPNVLPRISAATIPRLIHFVGSCQAAKVIVPGRPLESVHLHDGDLTEDEVAFLAQSTGQIAVLGAITSELLVPLLQALARHLPYLAYLRVMAPFHMSTKIPDSSFYEQVASTLTLMPELMDFELSGMHWGSSFESNETGPKRIWQAAPLAAAIDPREDAFELSSEYAFVY